MKPLVEVNDVIQIDPDSGVDPKYTGLFGVVTEVFQPGITVYIPTVGDGEAGKLISLSLINPEFKRVGQAPWIANEEPDDEEPFTNSPVSSPSNDPT